MKRITAQVLVECDDEVTPVMVRDMMANVLGLAFEETGGGRVYWRQAVVSARDQMPGPGEFRKSSEPAEPLPVTRRTVP